jgi:hypothetical protein
MKKNHPIEILKLVYLDGINLKSKKATYPNNLWGELTEVEKFDKINQIAIVLQRAL